MALESGTVGSGAITQSVSPNPVQYGNGWLGKAGNKIWSMINDYFTGEPSQERQYNYDISKLEKQMDFDREMWEKNNTYNSTEAQLERWIKAGGNPNAFFGGGTNVGNSQSVSAPSGGAGVGSSIGTLQNAVATATGATKEWWEARKAKAEAEGKEIDNGTLRQLNEATIAEIVARTKKDKADGRLSEANAKAILEMLPYQKDKTTAEIDKMKGEVNLMLRQQDEINARIRNLNADTRKKVQEKLKLEWEKTFRDTFGVDPTSGPIQMLIQNILSGKGENVIKTFFNYLEGVEDEIVEDMEKNKPRTFNGMLIRGLYQAIRDGYKNKYKKQKDWRDH